jgi:putative FmdB family regulatory protein
MPIYEYCCQSCGHEFEAIQKMSDDALSECPECNKPELKKLISASGFQLKGGGWYETDFKNSGSSGSSSGGGGCGSGGCGGN